MVRAMVVKIRRRSGGGSGALAIPSVDMSVGGGGSAVSRGSGARGSNRPSGSWGAGTVGDANLISSLSDSSRLMGCRYFESTLGAFSRRMRRAGEAIDFVPNYMWGFLSAILACAVED